MAAAPTASTPRARGFRWPAEWEPHEATLLAWPHDPQTFRSGVAHAEAAFVAFAAVLARGETVHMLVADEAMERRARAQLDAAGSGDVRLHRERTADVWFRDYGPITLVKGAGATRERLAMNFVFNAWGEKYETLRADTSIPLRIKDLVGIEVVSSELVLEGGSIEGDGEGTLLTTEQCLLGKNRNPTLTRTDIEARLRDYLAVEKVLWLGEGIEGDDTDGHIDDITRFVGPARVITAVQPNRDDPDHAVLAANLARLQSMTDARGRALDIVELPMPAAIFDAEGVRLPASHANFYVGNHAVCVPTFGSPSDAQAVEIVGACFPDREVVGIRCEHVVQGLGTLHCISQQVPR
ncbi:MAG: agmatine deiminase family protein [Planctomycetota bacterium]|nr:agmatine deiminase family protein [Planctomycetota bacterium]